MSSHRSQRRRFAILFFGAFIFFFGFAVNCFVPLRKSEATLVRYAEAVDAEGRPTYYPIFSIPFADGVQVSMTSYRADAAPKYDVGSKVTVLYSTDGTRTKVLSVAAMDRFVDSYFYF